MRLLAGSACITKKDDFYGGVLTQRAAMPSSRGNRCREVPRGLLDVLPHPARQQKVMTAFGCGNVEYYSKMQTHRNNNEVEEGEVRAVSALS